MNKIPRAAYLSITGGVLLLAMLATVLVVRHRQFAPSGHAAGITKVGNAAFGDLSLNEGSGASPLTTQSAADAGGLFAPSASEIAPGKVTEGGAASFTYGGASFSQSASSLGVLRRSVPTGPAIGSYLQDLGLSQISLSKLQAARVRSIQLADGASSYTFHIDYQSGQIYADLDPGMTAFSAGAAAQTALSDSRNLAIAAHFLAQFGVSTQDYGAPQVVTSRYGSVPIEPMAAAPDSAASSALSIYRGPAGTVIYPLQLKGLPVYDYSGNPVGLTLQVDQANERVSGMYGLSLGGYDESAYPAETDNAAILENARKGGVGFSWVTGDASQPLKLESPQMAYLQSGQTLKGVTADLFIPAYAFPVAAADQEKTSTKRVMVPLVSGLLDSSPAVQPLNSSSSSSAGSPVLVAPATGQ